MKLRKAWAAALAAAIPALAGVAMIALKGAPLPETHDEFAYLYAADTLAHGRLANPAHPLWPHFETFDLIVRPTMASRKPLGQGLALALGQIFLGFPYAGVLLTLSAACAAVFLALLAFVEPPWALVGGLLAATHPVVFSWSVSYWGGGVAMLGGALAIGAWKRLLSKPTPGQGAVYAAGLAILANSRPFEGLVFAAPLTLFLLWKADWRRAALPFIGVMLSAALFMGWANFRQTGSPGRFAYTIYEEEYDPVPLFIWQKIKPPHTYRNATLDAYWNGWELRRVAGQASFRGYVDELGDRFNRLKRAWLQPFPVKPLMIAALYGLAPPALMSLLALFTLGITLPVRPTTSAYISAPAVGLFFVVLTLALARLDGWRWRGRRAGRALVIVILAWFAVDSAWHYKAYAGDRAPSWTARKEDARARLLAEPGRHLVLVHYGPGHSVHQEWVYNEADMDASRIIWARSLSREDDAKLAAYYPDRAVWDLGVEVEANRLFLRRPPLK